MSRDLRPMGIGQILDAAIGLYNRRFATFVTISAVVYVPYSLVMAALLAVARSFGAEAPDSVGNTSFWTRLAVPTPPSMSASASLGSLVASASGPGLGGLGPNVSLLAAIAMALAVLVGALLFLGVVYPLCSGALMVNISASYLGEDLSAMESYRRVIRRLGRLLTAQFLVTVCVAFGVVCCVLPGLVIALWLMIVPAVVLLEDGSAWDALKRSRALMSGNLGRGFLLGLVAGLIGLLVSAAGGWVIRLVPLPGKFVSDFLESLLQALTLPLSAGTMVLLYYDLRIRKEGFDLEHLTAKMEDLRPDTLAPVERPPR